LASSIPDLQLDSSTINFDGGCQKLDTNGCLRLACENIVNETPEDGGFPNTTGANNNELEIGDSVRHDRGWPVGNFLKSERQNYSFKYGMFQKGRF
jgi:hypothetical protein